MIVYIYIYIMLGCGHGQGQGWLGQMANKVETVFVSRLEFGYFVFGLIPEWWLVCLGSVYYYCLQILILWPSAEKERVVVVTCVWSYWILCDRISCGTHQTHGPNF